MKQPATHEEQLESLKKIEGQVRGIQKMLEEKRYCIDIVSQIHSIIGALDRVENEIFKKHLDSCIISALKGKNRERKIEEIIDLISRFRKMF